MARCSGLNASPAMKEAGKDAGVERKSLWPNAQYSAEPRQYWNIPQFGGVEDVNIPPYRSVAMSCFAGNPSATAVRMSLPTDSHISHACSFVF